jgi:hypothetical protein
MEPGYWKMKSPWTVPETAAQGDYVVELRVNLPARTITEAQKLAPQVLAELSGRFYVEQGRILRVCRCCNRVYEEQGG